MVFYLKYRPQALSDLIGQDAISATLSSALKNNKLSHAYLFVGPRGVGKTSTARILAKMVNCEKGGCNECDICKSITDGSSLDLIEIDAASNRGIDDVRELRDKIKLSPVSLKKKVYIIDEVHMLTTEAFNALLKTLEEPPSHALFILATTEVQKVPATILSRVTRLDFKEAAPEGLESAFKRIAQEESLQIDEDALPLLIKKSDGSFRDGEKILDQLSSIDKHISKKLIEENLQGTKFESSFEILNLITQKSVKEAVEKANSLVSQGTAVKDLLYSLMDISRAVMLLKYGVSQTLSNEFGKTQIIEIETLAKTLSLERVLIILGALQKGYENLKAAALPLLPLEIALIESCSETKGEAKQAETEIVVASPSTGDRSNHDYQAKVEITTSPHLASPSGDELERASVSRPDDSLEMAHPLADESSTKKDDVSKSGDILTLKDKWTYILEMIRPYNFSLEALLKQVKIASADEGEVVLSVPYSFHQRILETPRNRDFLESVLSDVLGKPTRVSTLLESRPVRVEELANVEVAADDEVIRVAAEIFNS